MLLACLAQVEVWIVGDPDGPRPLVAFAALVMTLSLAWRRRAPVAVAAVVMAALTVLALVSNTPDVTVFGIAAVVLAMYSVAAHCELRGALVGAAVVLVPAFVLEAVVDGEFGNFFFIAVMNVSVWVAGRAVRSQGSRAARLADRTVVLEREREEKARIAVSEERARIARELHDIVAHSVTTMVVQAGAERRVLDDGQASTREVLAHDRADRPPGDGRDAPPARDAAQGRPGARARAAAEPGARRPARRPGPRRRPAGRAQGRGRAGAAAAGRRPVGLPDRPGGADQRPQARRPRTATVTVRYDKHELTLEIADSGRGAGNGNGGGHGLVGMRERVALFGGELDAGSRAGRATPCRRGCRSGPPRR